MADSESRNQRATDGLKPVLTETYPEVSTRQYLEALVADLQGQIDRRIETQIRELEAVGTHFDTMLNERDRATTIATEEREKAAAALRETLRNDLLSGDKALERHIDAQVESIKLALEAAEKLTDEQQRAQKEAVSVAFKASTELAAKHNDLIQSAERDKEKFATKGELGYMREILTKAEEREVLPREIFDAALAEWTVWRETVEKRLIGSAGYDSGKAEAALKSNRNLVAVAGFVVTIFVTALVIAANVLTTQ